MLNEILEDYKLPSGLLLKNRVVMAPMSTLSAMESGRVSDEELDFYQLRSDGPGLIITGSTNVSYKGKAYQHSNSVINDAMVPRLRKFSQVLKNHGSKAILQIYHGGAMVPSRLINGQCPVAVSVIEDKATSVDDWKELTSDEINQIISDFSNATKRALKAGFDGVEINCASPYLIEQFLSPYQNQRKDQWGGCLVNRMQFPLKVIEACIEAGKSSDHPFAVGVRLSIPSKQSQSISLKDTMRFIERLSHEPIDYIHYSYGKAKGTIEMMGKETSIPEAIKSVLKNQIPIIACGSIQTMNEAIEVLEEVPLFSMGRELVIEPKWTKKIMDERPEEIKRTISRKGRLTSKIPRRLWTTILDSPEWFHFEDS
ncbi:NADH-dependent flavin oxidoreductase [Desemzia sp. C1]|uniref:oxidoreductase n=1 Tax=Desemzia sp. C1 TaxID=2892016 RepID=UPI001E5EB117|nr:NADH-dependent flavin oxidoreductase [Desemzia sp. C1]MCI3029312.1 NADH-dependent flavin oxidoreductase [Desemzia sp. C1]